MFDKISDEHTRNAKQYIGEGLTFLVITILGAVFVYGAVRRQFRFHLQQKNFMMAVTHELKTPIAVTKLSLETLRRHKLDEAKQKEILSNAIYETERLTALCNNVLPLLKTFSLTNPVYATYISSLNTCCIPTTIILGEQNSINQFATVMGLINNNGAVSLTDNSAAGKAATQAYTDFSNTLKTITGTQDTATLVTIPQGSVIKMYVGQDIEFPKTAIDRSR